MPVFHIFFDNSLFHRTERDGRLAKRVALTVDQKFIRLNLMLREQDLVEGGNLDFVVSKEGFLEQDSGKYLLCDLAENAQGENLVINASVPLFSSSRPPAL